MYKGQKFKRVQISKDVILKSGLEEVVYTYLTNAKCLFKYESLKVTYFQPEVKKIYRPDFPIQGSFIIETKGAFNSADRKKMKLVKKQNPELDIRFIFSNSKTKIGKKSLTTYARWCELNDFPYHCIYSTQQTFPQEWLKEIKEKQNGKTRN
jgi:hypothetical protein